MPNISTNNKASIYKYKCSIQALFDVHGFSAVIEPIRIKTILIDYSYDKFAFPLIYVTVALTNDMRNEFINNKDSGTVLFTLQKYVENSDMPGLLVDVIKEECVYFINYDKIKKTEEEIDEESRRRLTLEGNIYTIGLIALKHINQNKTSVNGIINNGTMSSSIYYVLQDQNLLLEPLTYNPKLDSIIIPPVSSRSKAISYLNNLSAFYDTKYRFFMDFDTTYLISSSGKGVPKKGESINTVKIRIAREYSEENTEGMTEDKINKMYIVNNSATYTNLTTNDFTQKSVSSLTGVATNGSNEKVDVVNQSNSLIKNNANAIRLPNGNTNLLKSIQSNTLNNEVILSINKNKVDGSVFTLNKFYTVDATDAYGAKYNGTYLLASKKEIYAREGEGLASSVMLVFKKIQKLEE